MATTISNVYTTQWSGEVHQVYMQMKSVLRDNVNRVDGVVGNQFKFPVLSGGAVTNNKTADADLTLSGITHTVATATLTTCHAADRFDDLQQFQTNISFRKGWFTRLVGLVSKEMDQRIVTAMDTAATAVGTAGAMDAARITSLARKLTDASVPMDGRRVLVINGAALEDMQNDSKLANRDYISTALLGNGFVDNVSGFRIILVPDQSILPTGTGTRFNYAFHMDAVGLAIGKDLTSEFERIPHKDAWQCMVKMLAGAIAIDSTAIFKTEINN